MRTRLMTGLAGLALTLGASALAPRLATAQTAPVERVAPADLSAMLAEVATLLETRYVDPAIGKRYAALVRANAANGRYAAIADRHELATKITADLQTVHPDGHLRLTVAGERSAKPAAVSNTPREIAPGILEARWIDGDIAYIRFRRFSDDSAALAALTTFLAEHTAARALILDSRENGGGRFPMLGILADALYDRERPLVSMELATKVFEENGSPWPATPELRAAPAPAGLVRTVHWAVPSRAAAPLGATPVYYLISHRTYSAAEHMAFALKVTGRATLIGETTGGGNHFGGVEPVGAGLEMFVPSGRTSDLTTGADWEQVGVSPDVAVPADQALDEALRRIGAKSPN